MSPKHLGNIIMKIKSSLRIPIGFLAGIIYIWRADPTPLSFGLGALLMLFGELIRFVSSGTLVKFEGVTRNGIYACTRNPLYIGSFFLGMGACIIGRDIIFSVVFISLYIIFYRRVILNEERYLKTRYGDDYLRYLEEVPRIIPREISVSNISRETFPPLAIKNKEGKTILGITGVLIVMLVKMIMN